MVTISALVSLRLIHDSRQHCEHRCEMELGRMVEEQQEIFCAWRCAVAVAFDEDGIGVVEEAV
jgi:hypothetical protein